MNYKIITDPNIVGISSWQHFIYEHKNGNIFQTPEYYHLLLDSKVLKPFFIGICNDKNNILGVLVGVIQKEYLSIFSNLTARCIIWGGPIIKDNNTVLTNILLDEFNKEIKYKVIYCQFRNLFDTICIRDNFVKSGFDYSEHLDIHINLTLGIEHILNNMHKERRHNIRRAERKKLQFIELDSLQHLEYSYSLISQTYKRIKLPLYQLYLFKSAFLHLSEKKYLRIFAAQIDNKIISVRLLLCYKGIIYDWYAGTDNEYKNYYANDYLPFKVMEWGINNGYKVFDFGGAGKPGVPYGVRDFKLKYGGQLVNYGRYQNIYNPFIYSMASKLFVQLRKFKNNNKDEKED